MTTRTNDGINRASRTGTRLTPIDTAAWTRIDETPTMPLPALADLVFDKFGVRPRTETWERPVRRVYCLLDGRHSVRAIAAMLHMDMRHTLHCLTWLIARGYILQLPDRKGCA